MRKASDPIRSTTIRNAREMPIRSTPSRVPKAYRIQERNFKSPES